MTKQNFSQMTQKEAIDWIEKNCSFADVRNRMRSRAASWIVLNMLKEAVAYIAKLEETLKTLKEEIEHASKK